MAAAPGNGHKHLRDEVKAGCCCYRADIYDGADKIVRVSGFGEGLTWLINDF